MSGITFLFYFVVFILFVMWIISGVLLTGAGTLIVGFEGNDDKFNTAHKQAQTGAWITWGVLIASFFVLLAFIGIQVLKTILPFLFPEVAAVSAVSGSTTSNSNKPPVDTTADTGVSWWLILIGFLLLFLVGLSGYLGSAAAINISGSVKYKPDNNNMRLAYSKCVWAAILCYGTIGIMIISIIVYIVVQNNKKRNNEIELSEMKHKVLPTQAQPVKVLPTQDLPPPLPPRNPPSSSTQLILYDPLSGNQQVVQILPQNPPKSITSITTQ